MNATLRLLCRPAKAALGCATALVAAVLAPVAAQAGLGAVPMTTPPGASVVSVGRTAASAAATAAAAANSAMQAASVAPAASSPAAAASYTVRQTTLPNGTVVREYVSPDGVVFGVGWNGTQMPDLSALLGSYFPQYVAAARARHLAGTMHGQARVEQDGFVVHSGGHMGAFAGEAWLPQALPAGVSPADIR